MTRSRISALGLLAFLVLVALALLTHDDLEGDADTSARLAVSVAGDVVTLSGTVRDAATRDLLRTRSSDGGLTVKAGSLGLDPALTQPSWLGNLGPVIGALSVQLADLSLSVEGDEISLAGTATRARDKWAAVKLVRDAVPDARLTHRITVGGSGGATGTTVDRAQRALDAITNLANVEFATGSASLTPRGVQVLRRTLAVLRAAPSVRVEIAGYTDSDGLAANNLRLSRQRANTVRRWLIQSGIAAGRLTARGFGAADPVATNTTEAGRSRNRRIEFHVLGQ